jgi:hypothetical protein
MNKTLKTMPFAVILLVAAHPARLSAAKIISANETFTTHPSQLTIDGANFGVLKPTVKLDGLILTVISFSDTMIVAQVPASIDQERPFRR